MRCFISVIMPDEIKEKIFHASELLHKKGLFKGKITEKENLHLTLKFLGEVTEEQIFQVKEKLKKISLKKISASIGEAGVFNENFIKIAWLKIGGCDELQKEVDNSLEEMFGKEKRFMSHLTIARVKFVEDKRRLIEEIKKIKIKEKFEIESFELVKSELFQDGPRYKILASFPFNE